MLTGDGRLIFGLPPAEVAVHPAKKNGGHQFYLMVADVDAFAASMKKRKITCGPVTNRRLGLLTEITLPGGGRLGVYQPRHARPKAMKTRLSSRTSRACGAPRP